MKFSNGIAYKVWEKDWLRAVCICQTLKEAEAKRNEIDGVIEWIDSNKILPKYRSVCFDSLDFEEYGNNKYKLLRRVIWASREIALPHHTVDWGVFNTLTEKIVALGQINGEGHLEYYHILPDYADEKNCIKKCKYD